MNHPSLNASRLSATQHPRRGVWLAALAAGSLLLAGCATSTPPPTEQIAVADAALAQAAGAGGVEMAPTEMSMARDKMMRAHQAMGRKEHDVALALAQQALVDAQLASAKAESAKARKSADALREADGVLREEMARKVR